MSDDLITISKTDLYNLVDHIVDRIKKEQGITDDKWIDGEEAMRLLRIKSKTTGNILNYWYPFDPTGMAEFSYSIHLHDPSATGFNDLNAKSFSQDESIAIFPNPSDKRHTLFFKNEHHDTTIELYNLQGALMKTETIGNIHKGFTKDFEIHSLPTGIYIYRIVSDHNSSYIRFIKQ